MSVRAHNIGAGWCPHGCTVIVLLDADDHEIACCHVPPEHVEELVALIREARDNSVAATRPLT